MEETCVVCEKKRDYLMTDGRNYTVFGKMYSSKNKVCNVL